MSRLVHIAMATSLLFAVHGASAKDADNSCEETLSNRPKPIDYALSDLEGLFFELVTKAQSANGVAASRTDFFVNDLLSMKAEFLNDCVSLVAQTEKQKTLNSIYVMLQTIGVLPECYGLKMDGQSRVFREKSKSCKISATKALEKKGPIGFVVLSDGPGHDLPDGVHRSIGFAPQHIDTYAPPTRKTGFIQVVVSPKDPNSMVIYDGEKKIAYTLKSQILKIAGAETEDRKYELQFNQEIFEWVVAVENLANPSGKIGF